MRTAPVAADGEAVALGSQSAKECPAAASVNIYVLPDSRTYAQPTLAADHGPLHVEARYNYEALDTGSAWLGCNLGLGETVSVEFTPMLGGVFGNTTGVAPGYELTLAYWKLELYSEGEYLFDTSLPAVGAAGELAHPGWQPARTDSGERAGIGEAKP